MKERTNHGPFTGCTPGSGTPHDCKGSVIDRRAFERVLCPCACHKTKAEQQHEHGREESGRYIRLACSCGHRGPWRLIAAGLDRRLHSDDSAHAFAVRRTGA